MTLIQPLMNMGSLLSCAKKVSTINISLFSEKFLSMIMQYNAALLVCRCIFMHRKVHNFSLNLMFGILAFKGG